MKTINREALLSFWKAHILHHARTKAVNGQWILTELRRHGYELSFGTRYPLLERMERLGWLRGKAVRLGGARTRRDYRLTAQGEKVLELRRGKVQELYEEVVKEGGMA
ncbi:MAG TPA: helix-turn-helix transcriptional regulator [Candidatus Sulfotelmatobacter sp.]|nr:helix-turn-helix transcriptional regulator [Candidatus Sulfotelmatobacter sp.]